MTPVQNESPVTMRPPRVGYPARRMRQVLLAAAIVLALPLRAERVRVVVAVDLPEVGAASAGALRDAVMASVERAARAEPWGRGRAFSASLTERDIERLRRDPRVRAISLDTGGSGALFESVPRVKADLMHAQGFDGRGVTVAVLDTGIDARSPDFTGRIVGQRCFCDNLDGTGCCPGGDTTSDAPNAARDDNGHGTHVAGIIAGGGVSAPRGVAPGANILAVRVLDAGNRFRSFAQIHRALEWIAQERPDVRVINMSLGSNALFSTTDCGSAAIAWGMRDVIDLLRSRGVLIVASTGNESSVDGTTLPSCMREVVAVGATFDADGAGARADQITPFTNSTDAIDVVAPGAAIVSTRRGGGASMAVGTSMAAPHVTGALALMHQKSRGTLSADQAEELLRLTGQPVLDGRNGLLFPRLDVAAAVNATPVGPTKARRRAVR